MLLEGKRIIVTGGVTGIGKATVLEMVKEGAAVVSMSRAHPEDERASKVIDAAAELGKGPVRHLRCDVSKEEEVNAAFAEAIDFLGGLDSMVNCAGTDHQGPTAELTVETLLDQLTQHVVGTHLTNLAAFRHYRNVGGGAIINYASYAGAAGLENMGAYSAAKGGVIGYTRAVAKEWASNNIRVNVVLPGVMTELAEETINNAGPDVLAAWRAWLAATIPLGGMLGDVQHAANFNVYLSSDKGSFIHGQTIGVDGGMFMGR